MDAALNDEVARLFERERGPIAGLLIPSIECEPIGLDEGVMDRTVIPVDQDDRVTSAQEQVGGGVLPPLLQHDANDIGKIGLGRSECE